MALLSMPHAVVSSPNFHRKIAGPPPDFAGPPSDIAGITARPRRKVAGPPSGSPEGRRTLPEGRRNPAGLCRKIAGPPPPTTGPKQNCPKTSADYERDITRREAMIHQPPSSSYNPLYRGTLRPSSG
ncbi:hypothetical protein WN944_000486 [Citrus x changshan-huyou]|uniref:Uncharacterized protein n=1 Tax=Citrus x changshan-huyou TaxID=2935761 RepID=A0AAP0MCZ1_9ROSI